MTADEFARLAEERLDIDPTNLAQESRMMQAVGYALLALYWGRHY